MTYQLQQVRHDYGARRIVDVETMTIAPGEIVAIVGPSGAGKSTLLRLLAGLEAPSHGHITFDAEPLSPSAPLSVLRRVTLVFQRPALLQRSVYENVSYGLRVRGQTPGAHVDAALAQVGLTALAHAPAHKLSGGEMQRVALARALVLQPSALLLDEPTANLDPYNVSVIEQILREHNQQHRTTLVLVTHNLFQARRLAHRVGLLLEGRLIELADTHTFFEAPHDPRTAAFVRGEMIY